MLAQPVPRLTAEEYLAKERAAEYKSEYYQGEMFALAGATEKHNLVTLNIAATLHLAVKNMPCKVYSSDMRVKVEVAGLYTYPDVVALCSTAEFDDAHGDTLLNPELIVEVLSVSTEAYDRGKKFEYYRSIPSLREYVLVAQDRVHVDVFTRSEEGRWVLSEASGRQGHIGLASLGYTLLLADVYSKVEFEGEQ